MESKNSSPDLYLDLVCGLYRDIAQCYSVSSRVQRIELRVIEERYRREGLSFLTKGLPRLGKAVDTALSAGIPLAIKGFTLDGAIPKFLGWLLSRVFDTVGLELDQPDPVALKHFRQFVYLLYKLAIPYEKTTAQAVVDSFVKTEADLSSINLADLSDADLGWINDARDFITRVISPIDPLRITPKHGPGAVATGEHALNKCEFSRIYESMERVYPFTEWMRFNLSHVAESWQADQQRLSLEKEPTARVVLVPKDSRGPRLISCEPLEVQWIQQGLGSLIKNQIELSRWTRGHVNFTDQSINRRLSLSSSLDGRWVTLDMKEASDRVSLDLVERLFSGHPTLVEAMKACRSTRTLLPDGTVMTLKKFAPMGSNLCFPVESLVFYALAVSAIKRTGYSWRKARASVFVYGDDIIVDSKVYKELTLRFPVVGLMFNADKCCTASSFRESCGCDAYHGVDITPVRLKTVWSHRRTDPVALASYVAFRNAMWSKGYDHAVQIVEKLVHLVYGGIPYTNDYTVHENGSCVSNANAIAYTAYEPCRHLNRRFKRRFNKHLFYSEVLSYQSSPVKRRTRHDGYQEWLRRLSDNYGAHGGYYALVRRNRLKRTWLRE
jgi:hypothetical protein